MEHEHEHEDSLVKQHGAEVYITVLLRANVIFRDEFKKHERLIRVIPEKEERQSHKWVEAPFYLSSKSEIAALKALKAATDAPTLAAPLESAVRALARHAIESCACVPIDFVAMPPDAEGSGAVSLAHPDEPLRLIATREGGRIRWALDCYWYTTFDEYPTIVTS